jgi:hypothetical protein
MQCSTSAKHWKQKVQHLAKSKHQFQIFENLVLLWNMSGLKKNAERAWDSNLEHLLFSWLPEGYDMNGRFQMQGGKNWFYRKRWMQTGSSWTLIGWKSGTEWRERGNGLRGRTDGCTCTHVKYHWNLPGGNNSCYPASSHPLLTCTPPPPRVCVFRQKALPLRLKAVYRESTQHGVQPCLSA